MSDYPEHEKLKAIRDESQAIGTFIDWLGEEGLFIMKHNEFGDGRPHNESTEKLLARHFEIDLNILEAEKRAMIAKMQELNS